MNCAHPIRLTAWEKMGNAPAGPAGFFVPCGHCILCRIRKIADWTTRIMLEQSTQMEGSCFVTLTYDDEHLPENQEINKRDLQLFLKRLRKEIYPQKIKYFACGEYGKQSTLRPHYHVIILGWMPPLSDCRKIGRYLSCDTISKLWPAGFNTLGPVQPKAVRYALKYVVKGLSREMSRKIVNGRQPPFQLQSQGIGLTWLSRNHSLLQDGKLYLNGKQVGIPMYFKRKLVEEMPEYQETLRRIGGANGLELSRELDRLSGGDPTEKFALYEQLLHQLEVNALVQESRRNFAGEDF